MPQVPAFHSIKEHHRNNSRCGPGSEIPGDSCCAMCGFEHAQ
jgi:hypothetical protein